MNIIGTAHEIEQLAARARDRALCRLSSIVSETTSKPDFATFDPILLGVREWRRWVRAQVAYGESLHTLFAAQQRHSMWYRRLLRHQRKSPDVSSRPICSRLRERYT